MSEPIICDADYLVEGDDIRLDRVLRTRFGGSSWTALRKAIRTGKVRVDGATLREPSKQLRKGQRVTIVMATPKRLHKRIQHLPKGTVVFLDPHYVVANKPAGLNSVPDEKHPHGSFAQLLGKELAQKGRRNPPLGVVQRLDAGTSGLMVFARTRDGLGLLKDQFRERSVRRHYVALVAGRARTTSYSSYLTEHADGKRKSTQHAHLGKYARTNVKLLKLLDGASLVRCQLDTGRTHQIRIHLSEAGHPLLGDRRYARRHVTAPHAERMMLHAASLGFEGMDENPLDFEVPLPPDFEAMMKKLGKKA